MPSSKFYCNTAYNLQNLLIYGILSPQYSEIWLMFDQNLNIRRASLSPLVRREIEAWVVNSLKVKMIRKLDNLVETPGRINARKLFLVPIFTVAELAKRIEESAPELKTIFFKELTEIISEAERKM